MKIIQANSIPKTRSGQHRDKIVWHWPIADQSVQTIFTSPPYAGQRVYGDSSQEYGWGSLKEYINGWTILAREAHRVLRDDGLFVFNVGDKASGSGGAGGDYNSGGGQSKKKKYGKLITDMAERQWCMAPFKMADAMQDLMSTNGRPMWLLRSLVIWDKGQVEVCSGDHIRRPKTQFEYIFFFSKGNIKTVKDYKFYFDRLEEPGDVWHVKPNKSGDKGDAPFPDELAERVILPTTDPGDVVLDPFSGSGTTARVADQLDRIGIGMELYV